MHEITDFRGRKIHVGSKVRVLSIRPSIIARLSKEQAKEVTSMCGEIFEVYEIDAWGSAWVKKEWKEKGVLTSHSLALSSIEMECVNPEKRFKDHSSVQSKKPKRH